jgi:hypothetical protein
LLEGPSSTEEGGIAKEIFGGRLKSQVKTCKLIFATVTYHNDI